MVETDTGLLRFIDSQLGKCGQRIIRISDSAFRYERHIQVVQLHRGSVCQNIMHPGMTMIVTDLPAHRDRRSKEDLVIMTVS